MRRVAVPASALVVLLVGVLTSCAEASSSHVLPPAGTVIQTARIQAARSPQARTKSPKPTPLRRCCADQLRFAVTLTAAAMSQPFSSIAVTNVGAASCVLRGYPRIHVWDHRGFWQNGRSPTVRLGIRVHHGIYERVDQGPHRVVLRPHHQAFFSIATGTVFQGGQHMMTLTRLAVIAPGTQVSKTLSIKLLTAMLPGRRIPVGITAVTDIPRP